MPHLKKLLATAMALTVAVTFAACGSKEAAEETAVAETNEPDPYTEEATESHAEEAASASATFASNDGAISGEAVFTEADGGVAVHVSVTGAPTGSYGSHGFHIHQTGDCSAEDFTSAGGHFNPTGAIHGGPDDAERHAGDLGNIEIGEDGSGMLMLTSDLITVGEGPNSVVGRGVILHAGADDLSSQPTGAAGGRLACGVVEAGA